MADPRRTQFGQRHLNDASAVFQHNAWILPRIVCYCTVSDIDLETTRQRKKPQCGSRKLVKNKLYEFNAWDDVPWDKEQEENAVRKVTHNSSSKISEERANAYEENAADYWDSFYNIHSNKFFKDRHWLLTEFPELDSAAPQKSDLKIFEIGCGVGNTVFPLIRQLDPGKQTFMYASDFSENAINILRENSEFDSNRCEAFVLDVTEENWNVPFEKDSIDIVVIIFVLSAVNPNKFQHIIGKIKEYLAPGGLVLFRDYGRYDMAQLRFKDGQCLSDNFYVRGDGTRVYFFTQDDVRSLFTKIGFVEEQNLVDRRLQVNRGKMIKMYRVWIQAKYRKPLI